MTALANIGFGVAIAGALATIGILVYDATKKPAVTATRHQASPCGSSVTSPA